MTYVYSSSTAFRSENSSIGFPPNSNNPSNSLIMDTWGCSSMGIN